MTDLRLDGQTSHIEELLELFRSPPDDAKLSVYFTPDEIRVTREQVASFVALCRQRGIGCIIPRLAPAVKRYTDEAGIIETPTPPSCFSQEKRSPEQLAAIQRERLAVADRDLLEAYRALYRMLIEEADACGIAVALNVEMPLEYMVVRAAKGSGMRAYMLTRREYYLNQQQQVSLLLSEKGKRQSVMAVDISYGEMVDLRDMVGKGNLLSWDVPTGNWCVHEFLCRYDTMPHANYLDYEASCAFLDAVWERFADIFSAYPQTIRVLYMADVGFHAPNHRSWTPRFNERFTQAFGNDPAPLYPHLYEVENADTPQAKAALFSCRAIMLREGIWQALADTAARRGLQLLASTIEPKLSAPSLTGGDVVANAAIAPGAVLDRAYLYGVNSLKIVSAGSYNYRGGAVSCELGRDYVHLTPSVLYKDTLTALGRGANLLMAHVGTDMPSDPVLSGEDYAEFTARASALLRVGSHVSDIAVLYPIHSLHSSVSFYEAPARGFEYPDTPVSVDYPVLINSLACFAGHDVTLLHPDVMCERCSIEGNVLRLQRENGESERFRVLVLPAAQLVRRECAEMARDFYRSGGKLIATGERLPTMAYLTDAQADAAAEDAVIRGIMREIFGNVAGDPGIVAGRLYAKNDCGGEAHWLYPGRTATDGTMMVDSSTVARALFGFNLPLDVYIPTMPRFGATGALNNAYPEFAALGLNHIIPGGGMLSHIHRRYGGSDIYFFANTTDSDFEGEVFLRGEHRSLVLCDPHTGAYERPVGHFEIRYGRIYTRFVLYIPTTQGRFLVAE